MSWLNDRLLPEKKAHVMKTADNNGLEISFFRVWKDARGEMSDSSNACLEPTDEFSIRFFGWEGKNGNTFFHVNPREFEIRVSGRDMANKVWLLGAKGNNMYDDFVRMNDAGEFAA